MKWLCKRIHRQDKGFTLVELMVVIIILAVLTGIAIPSYLALRNRARNSATRSEMANIGTALELYMADNDAYPVADATWDVTNGDLTTYMAVVPDNDAWTTIYVYTRPTATTYTLTSWGADTVADAADNIILTNGNLN